MLYASVLLNLVGLLLWLAALGCADELSFSDVLGSVGDVLGVISFVMDLIPTPDEVGGTNVRIETSGEPDPGMDFVSTSCGATTLKLSLNMYRKAQCVLSGVSMLSIMCWGAHL